MKPIGNSLCEAVYLAGLPALSLTNSDDPPGSYHSRDVFEPHPTIPSRWKYISRLDDRITLVNGEKVLPLPIEGTIKQNPLVQEAVVAGVGKAVPGLLVFRSEESKGLSDEEYFDSIWPTVQEANSRAEQFSQVAREMITVIPHDAPCPRTDKGSIIRTQVYMKYAEVIENMYTSLDKGEGGTLELDIPATEARLMKLCQEEIGLSISEADVDLFSQGVDSLKAIHLRRLILRDFKVADSGAISQNVVFETGSVARLAKYVCAVQSGRQTTAEDEVSLMPKLIEKYSSFHQHSPNLESVKEKSVVCLHPFLYLRITVSNHWSDLNRCYWFYWSPYPGHSFERRQHIRSVLPYAQDKPDGRNPQHPIAKGPTSPNLPSPKDNRTKQHSRQTQPRH